MLINFDIKYCHIHFSKLLSFEVVYYKMFILSKMYFVSFLKKEFGFYLCVCT